MFYLYPANKMENLLVLLNKIQQLSPLPVFAQDTVIVQSAGLQHWLNMSLSQQRGISMNMRYALPSQFLWNLIRNLASDDDVPEQSPYSREVLSWRIDALLACEQVINDDSFNVATHYWCSSGSKSRSDDSEAAPIYSEAEQLKRYQLACQLADLYEQYLIFRPEWIHAWHQGEFTAYDQQTISTQVSHDTSLESTAIWQGKLWHLLVSELPYDPKKLVALAINNLNTLDLNSNTNNKAQLLPQRLSFFGINAMAPLWLEFINALSEKIDVHFFHLNPCYDYWGDLVTEKRAIEAWIKGQTFTGNSSAEGMNQVGNPLLANLGQQGREFMALLYQYSTVNIDVFESAAESIISEGSHAFKSSDASEASVLGRVQDDILSLSDARHSKTKTTKVDDSIVITSAHSALREVQGLHDWLLHQFTNDKTLTPKDVLVMCPQVEQYAPYVNAVFTRGWQDIADEVPPLPCSIADRISKDSEPLVAAFAQLLKLPDSRFQVSSMIALLRLPAMQKRFALNLDDIEKITHWLEVACIHWGLDQSHKQQVLAQSNSWSQGNNSWSQGNNSWSQGNNSSQSNDRSNSDTNDLQDERQKTPSSIGSVSNSFTWQQGLSRLMQGFAFGDDNVIYQNQMLLPDIEGGDGELLGKLMLIIEQLQLSSMRMTKARSATHWQQFLLDLLQQLFEDENDNGLNIVRSAIESFVEYCQHARYNTDISLSVIREYLNGHFSQPDPGRQFMVGQVTFCSMLPMRSIPFKVIAVLGLNDGEFPRQRQPLSFDLMATTPAQLGDRSRRGDDRYLFLEAIISARQALYLSYQGRNIKNNKERQPSLVLKELMQYLARGYGWRLLGLNKAEHENQDNNLTEHIRQLPMQAFSEKNYVGRYASFDANWLNLKRARAQLQNELPVAKAHSSIAMSDALSNSITEQAVSQNVLANDVIRFYQHPSRYYAQGSLYLYLDQTSRLMNDVEPFVANRLDSYLLRQELLSYYLSPEQSKQSCEDILLSAKLSGTLPDLPTTEDLIAGWQNDSEAFSRYIVTELSQTIPKDNAQDNAQDSAQASNGLAITEIDCSVSLNLTLVNDRELYTESELTILKNILPDSVNLTTKLSVIDNKLVFYRSSSAKAKDLFTLYFHQLILQVAQTDSTNPDNERLTNVVSSHGYYFDTKSQKPSQFYFSHIADAKNQLQHLMTMFYLGQQQPLLLNGDLVEKIRKSKVFEQPQFEQFWSDSNSFQAFGEDAYMQYFWPTCPSFDDIAPRLLSIYQPMLDTLQSVKQGKVLSKVKT